MGILVYNRSKETHSGPSNYRIFRPTILGNPFTHIRDKQTKAMFVCKSREEAISNYSHYFDVMYGSNLEFTRTIDEIYEKYKRGEDIFLECYCKPQECHGDIIANKLRQRLIKEKLQESKAWQGYTRANGTE